MKIVVGDIGGTHARFALAELTDSRPRIGPMRKYRTREYAGLEGELRQQVRAEISPIATPDLFHFTPALPKTRSGKIMRRILRKIAENDYGALGDTSTLADPSLVDDLIEGRRNR